MIVVQTSSLTTTREGRTDLELPKSPVVVKIWPVQQLIENPHSQGLYLFDLTQDMLWANSPISREFAGKKQSVTIV